MDTDPNLELASAADTDAPQLRRDLRDRAPRRLSVAVIVWMDDPDLEPTVIAHHSPVVVARAAALAIHEMITDPYAYSGATEFLQAQKPPQDWRTPEDVDAWLEALRDTTSYPAFSFHSVSVTGDTNGPSGLSVDQHLQQALRERERALQPDDPADLSGGELGRPGLDPLAR